MSSPKTITIPQVELTLDQLVEVIRHLDPGARVAQGPHDRVAKALMDTELDVRMAELIKSLADRPAADDLTDADIASEADAVREQRRR